MSRGPKLIDNTMNFTTRDNLGIESVANSISAEICPVVTTVTPRAFYWSFLIWGYYDFYKYSGIQDHTIDAFNRYLKHQDYFFVMAVLAAEDPDQQNLVGKTQAAIDVGGPGPYEYNPKYFQVRYGGMQYYNGGCLALGYIIDQDPETGKYYSLPKLTRRGEEVALAFEKVIKDTTYYKEYRRSDSPVPRMVLKEYGRTINLAMRGFDENKRLLREDLFSLKRNRKLAESADYIHCLYDTYHVRNMNLAECRRLLYDRVTADGRAITLPEELKSIGNAWEIVVGRQYFVVGLEMIWSYMLECLDQPLTLKSWIERVLKTTEFPWDLGQTVGEILESCIFTYDEREKMVRNSSSRVGNHALGVANGVKLILSVYNRMINREDFGSDNAYLQYGLASHSIAITELFKLVAEYREKSLQSFLVYIMEHWLVQQHYITAFEKLMQNRNGFFYEVVDGMYIRKCGMGVGFQGIRLSQLMQVMKDLDMLQEGADYVAE